MTVTAAEGNMLLGLAGAPALEKVRQVVAALPSHDQELAVAGLQIGIAMDEYAGARQRGLPRSRPARRRHRPWRVAIGDIVEVGRTVRLQVRDAEAADGTSVRAAHGVSDAVRSGGRRAAVLVQRPRGGTVGVLRSRRDGSPQGARRRRPSAASSQPASRGPVGGRNHLHGFSASILAFGQSPSAPS